VIIDFSAHLLTLAVIDELRKSPYYTVNETPIPTKNADLSYRLKVMKKYGIDMQVLSLTSASLMEMDARQAAKVCRLANDSISDFCEKEPDRFVGLAGVSLLDVDNAIGELDRTIKDLGFRGVIVASNQEGKGLDSPEYFPFYERAVKYDVPILVHPTHWKDYPLVDKRIMIIFGWPFDTTQAVWRMITGGVFDKFPTLKVVMHHLGAMFPFFGGRVNSYVGQALTGRGQKKMSAYWKQIYGDTAIDGMPGAYMCGYSFFGPDRIVFGTDYPFGLNEGESFIRNNLKGVKAMSIPAAAREKIFSRNAMKLLKIKK
jgi:uncharacterized protein